MISAPPRCSYFNQRVEVQKWAEISKNDQSFPKTWSRANRPPTLNCDSSQVTQVWTMLLQNPQDSSTCCLALASYSTSSWTVFSVRGPSRCCSTAATTWSNCEPWISISLNTLQASSYTGCNFCVTSITLPWRVVICCCTMHCSWDLFILSTVVRSFICAYNENYFCRAPHSSWPCNSKSLIDSENKRACAYFARPSNHRAEELLHES